MLEFNVKIYKYGAAADTSYLIRGFVDWFNCEMRKNKVVSVHDFFLNLKIFSGDNNLDGYIKESELSYRNIIESSTIYGWKSDHFNLDHDIHYWYTMNKVDPGKNMYYDTCVVSIKDPEYINK